MQRRRAVVLVAGALYVGAGRAALEALVRNEPWNWWLFLLYACGWLVGMAVFWAVLQAVRYRDAPRDRDLLEGRNVVEEALRTGLLPEGLAPVAWRRAMTEEIRSARHNRWAVAALGLCIVVLVAVAAVLDSDPVAGVLAAVLVLASAAVDRWCARRVRQAEDLLAALGAG
ncbi:hypothetical protein [Blastococcus sp. SYSU D01042]